MSQWIPTTPVEKAADKKMASTASSANGSWPFGISLGMAKPNATPPKQAVAKQKPSGWS
jgi:hypothetical protein